MRIAQMESLAAYQDTTLSGDMRYKRNWVDDRYLGPDYISEVFAQSHTGRLWSFFERHNYISAPAYGDNLSIRPVSGEHQFDLMPSAMARISGIGIGTSRAVCEFIDDRTIMAILRDVAGRIPFETPINSTYMSSYEQTTVLNGVVVGLRNVFALRRWYEMYSKGMLKHYCRPALLKRRKLEMKPVENCLRFINSRVIEGSRNYGAVPLYDAFSSVYSFLADDGDERCMESSDTAPALYFRTSGEKHMHVYYMSRMHCDRYNPVDPLLVTTATIKDEEGLSDKFLNKLYDKAIKTLMSGMFDENDAISKAVAVNKTYYKTYAEPVPKEGIRDFVVDEIRRQAAPSQMERYLRGNGQHAVFAAQLVKKYGRVR